ncbi:ABC transporter permease [Oceanobacillus chungangensis]|nr:ABC transporter permease [Oceanobacillus chungangensis]
MKLKMKEIVVFHQTCIIIIMVLIEWNKETQKVDNTGLFYVYTFFQSLIYLFPSLLLIILFGTGFAAEKWKVRTLYFLKTQPVSNFDLLMGKYMTSIAFTVGTSLGLIFLMVIIGTIGNRFGDWSFPVLYYETIRSSTSIEGDFHFINMGNYLVETSILFLASLVFLLTLSIFLSLFFTNTISSVIATFILAIGLHIASNLPQTSFMAHISPFTYLNVGKIANGEMATLLNNHLIQPWIGIISLLASTIIILAFSFLWIQKLGIKRVEAKSKYFS